MNTRIALLAFLLLVAPVLSQAQDAGPACREAVLGTVRDVYERSGSFVPADPAELRLALRHYRSELRLLDVLPHGSFVNQGDVIARIDPRWIDEQVEKDQRALARSELDLSQTEARAKMAAESAKASWERAERDMVRAAKRLKGYREHEKAFEDESERLTVQGRKHRIEDQADELTQLEKMYAEDELVDATEEIVLKRQRRNFARSKASHDLSERRRLYRKEFFETWRVEDLELEARHKAEGLERTRSTQAMDRAKREADLAKRRFDLDLARRRFAELKADQELFVVRAPRRGLLLHGSGKKPVAANAVLAAGSTLKNHAVFAVVADPNQLAVVATVEETSIFELKSGMAVEVSPKVDPDRKLMGRLRVDYLPGPGGVFAATVTLEQGKVELRPGMTCDLSVILEEERDVVLVPANAVFHEGDRAFVRCAKSAEGPFEERPVVTGLTDGENCAIREGVAVGEFVALSGK